MEYAHNATGMADIKGGQLPRNTDRYIDTNNSTVQIQTFSSSFSKMVFSNSVLAAATLYLGHVLAAPATSASQLCQARPATPAMQAQLWSEYVKAFYVEQNVSKAFEYIAPGYIQHNAFSVGQGAASSKHQIEPILAQAHFTLLHNTYSKGFGWAHSEVVGGSMFPNKTAVLDIYRYDGACIIEHWDSLQVANQYTVNPAFPN